MLGVLALVALVVSLFTDGMETLLGTPVVWVYTVAFALAAAPLGALAGWLVWRRLHREEPS